MTTSSAARVIAPTSISLNKPVSQPKIHDIYTSLDICIQRITSEKAEYLGLYLHLTSQPLDQYLIRSMGKTTYSLEIPLQRWKELLEQTLQENDLTKYLQQLPKTLKNHPSNIYSYVFSIQHYSRIGEVFVPHFSPPFWEKLKNKKNI